VVRQVLNAENHPAVILLFMMKYTLPIQESTDTAEPWQAAIGDHYALPMVSYYDAIAPELLNGTLTESEITPDGTHPTDVGHAYAALFLATALQQTMKIFPPQSSPDQIPPTARPLYSDKFEFTTLVDGTGDLGAPLNPTTNVGWTVEPASLTSSIGNYVPSGLQSSTPGSTLDFTVLGQDILIGFWMIKGPMGEVRATVDGNPVPGILEGWYSAGWGGFRGERRVGAGFSPGLHQVHLELLSSHAAGSTGTAFRILSVGSAGIETGKNPLRFAPDPFPATIP